MASSFEQKLEKDCEASQVEVCGENEQECKKILQDIKNGINKIVENNEQLLIIYRDVLSYFVSTKHTGSKLVALYQKITSGEHPDQKSEIDHFVLEITAIVAKDKTKIQMARVLSNIAENIAIKHLSDKSVLVAKKLVDQVAELEIKRDEKNGYVNIEGKNKKLMDKKLEKQHDIFRQIYEAILVEFRKEKMYTGTEKNIENISFLTVLCVCSFSFFFAMVNNDEPVFWYDTSNDHSPITIAFFVATEVDVKRKHRMEKWMEQLSQIAGQVMKPKKSLEKKKNHYL